MRSSRTSLHGLLAAFAQMTAASSGIPSEAMSQRATPRAPKRKPMSETDLLGLRWDAKCRWNSQADAYNAWDELGQDEQDLLVGREVERFHGIEE